jgi:hypothetical protein
MVGGSEFRCTQCLKASPERYLGNCTYTQQYLWNVLTPGIVVAALKGSCSQQPPLGTMIGLSSSVFTYDEITPTFPGDNPNTRSSNDKKGLSRSAIIGISIGVCGLLLIILAILYWLARRQRFKHMKGLDSGFDERFGAPNITSPNSGAYGNPYASPAVHSAPLRGRLLMIKITPKGRVTGRDRIYLFSVRSARLLRLRCRHIKHIFRRARQKAIQHSSPCPRFRVLKTALNIRAI